MRKYNVTITRNFADGSEVDDNFNNLSQSRLERTIGELASDTRITSFVVVVSFTNTGKHPAPFAKTKAGARRRAERNFTAQGAYDDLWGPPLENVMDWEQ